MENLTKNPEKILRRRFRLAESKNRACLRHGNNNFETVGLNSNFLKILKIAIMYIDDSGKRAGSFKK